MDVKRDCRLNADSEFSKDQKWLYTDCVGFTPVDDWEIDRRYPKEIAAAVGTNGQIELSPDLRRALGLKPGSTVRVVQYDNRIEVFPDIHSLGKLYIEPTTRCNISCQTCIRQTWHEPLGFMSHETFEALISQIRGIESLRTVMLGGFGEPTFHPEIVWMVRQLKSLGLRVEITTNGTLLDGRLSRELLEAGLDMLWVSFDGVSAEVFEDIRSGAHFQALVDNVLGMNKLGKELGREVAVGIAFVITKRNVNQLEGLPKLAKRINAQAISVSNVLPYTEDMVDDMVYDFGDSLQRMAFETSVPINIPVVSIEEEAERPLLQLFKQNDCISIMKNPVGVKEPSCRFIQERCTFVRWDGAVCPCMGLLHSYETYISRMKLKRSITCYTLGSILDRDLKDIWESEEYRGFRDKVDAFDFAPCLHCGTCELVETNEEDCYSNTFPVCGGCLWGYGVIQCP